MIFLKAFVNKPFRTIYGSICSCIPDTILNVFGFSKVIYVLSCLITSAIIAIASILFCTVCIAVSDELPKTDYLLNIFFDTVREAWSDMFDDTVPTSVNDTISTAADTISPIVDDTMFSIANDTMSTSLANIHTHTKPTKITTIHEDNIPFYFPAQQHPRYQAVHMWSPSGRFSAIHYPTRLCNHNNPLLLGYSPRIDVGLHWHRHFNTIINGVLFEFSERVYPAQPNYLRIYTQVNIRSL